MPTLSKPTRREAWQGGNWLRRSTRLAIHLRDGCACAWCGAAVEDGATLTIDHVVPVARHGGNAPANLVTACARCNSSRGSRSVPAFAAAVAAYLDHGVAARDIARHVEACRRRALPRREALELLARRGTVRAAMSDGGMR